MSELTGSRENVEQTQEITPFLAGLSEEDIRAIYAAGEVQEFSAGSIALSETDLDTSVYIVLEGQAEVSIPARKGWLRAATLLSGSIFGELSFFDRMPRSARVSVITDCTVLKISESAFEDLLARDSRVAVVLLRELARILSLRVRHMNQLVQTLSK